jgi:signal peptidase I
MPITINTAKKPEPLDDGRSSSGSAPENKDHEGREGAKWLTWVIDITIIVVVMVLMLTIRFYLYDIAIVTSRSMEPTLGVGDRLVFDHRKSLAGQWKRGDIVFFDPPESWGSDDPSVLVKRLIALPGETIEVRQGRVFVNGQEIAAGAQENAEDFVPPTQLGSDQYFVLGDNRDNSDDSRKNGPITRDVIHGRAVFRMWPLSRVGRLPAWQP